MRFIADLHIHSHYSRATSPEMNIVSLTKWSQLKGTNVVGTGDFTHPKYFEELKETLEPAEPGLWKLRDAHEKEIHKEVPELCWNAMRFMLTSEISTIYKKNDRVRKVHSLIYAPSFEIVEKINEKLATIGNIAHDGRPILGLDTKDLFKIALEASPDIMFVPAHAWTPHFSVFGSMSGFDSLEECFDELAPEIFAIETGLSSDPSMNWQVEALDRLALISNSDAHSAAKLGREANVFNTELSYYAIRDALKENDLKAFEKTIEFFPEEGKYHFDGHRNCKVSMTPEETKKNKMLCPECGKPVTVGVLHRVDDLANHKLGRKPEIARPFQNIIPLPEILAETEGAGPSSKKVQSRWIDLLGKLGSEFKILLDTPIEKIESASTPIIAEAIQRMREDKIKIEPGYDGEYGHISIWPEGERQQTKNENQTSLF